LTQVDYIRREWKTLQNLPKISILAVRKYKINKTDKKIRHYLMDFVNS
jgi:hypothetical protein